MDRFDENQTTESVESVDAASREPLPVDDAGDRPRESNASEMNADGVRSRRRSLIDRRNDNSDNNLTDLPQLSIPSANGSAHSDPEEAADESVQVFETFVLMEIQEEHLSPPEGFPRSRPSTAVHMERGTGSSFDMEPHSDNYQTVAARLNSIARDMESHHRVRDDVVMANLVNMTKDAFWAALNHFIDNGITIESIVRIFTFCRYVAIQYIKDNKKELFRQIMKWAVQFILARISTWVQEHGGWNHVLMSWYAILCQHRLAVTIVLGVCVIAGIILWRKYR